MKRASYREAVQWVALNDSSGDTDALDMDACQYFITAALVADIFDVSAEVVGKDVVRYRLRLAEVSGPS